MNSLLIHGCYDSKTLETLKEKGIREFSFDLRGRSSNLIPFRELQLILQNLKTEKIFLTFENDQKETILSFFNLLHSTPFTFTIIYRDNQSASFYEGIDKPFYWMFRPEGEWREILKVDNIVGILLPLKYQLVYQKLPELWKLIEEQNLDVYIHAETFEETAFIKVDEDIKVSIDLSPEVEKGFRTVDQERLKQMRIWRRPNENPAGQR